MSMPTTIEQWEEESRAIVAMYWVKDDDGNFACYDCTNEVSPDDVYGNDKYGVPRCESCHYDYKNGD